MKIKRMLDQNRRDFWADFECESCGHVESNMRGYDDRNFHDNVIPNFKCKECGKSRNDLNITQNPTPTRYSDWENI